MAHRTDGPGPPRSCYNGPMSVSPQLSVVTATAAELRERVHDLAIELGNEVGEDAVAALQEAERALATAVRRLEHAAGRLR